MTLETSVFAQRTLCKVNGPDDSSCRLTRSVSLKRAVFEGPVWMAPALQVFFSDTLRSF
jgi:hypothetical protein